MLRGSLSNSVSLEVQGEMQPCFFSGVRKYLSVTGLRADVAINVKQAIEAILKRKSSCNICNYKVVFMDINMPVMNGIVAMKKITELVNTGVIPDIPVIAVTAAVHTEDEQTILTYKEYGFKRLCKLS